MRLLVTLVRPDYMDLNGDFVIIFPRLYIFVFLVPRVCSLYACFCCALFTLLSLIHCPFFVTVSSLLISLLLVYPCLYFFTIFPCKRLQCCLLFAFVKPSVVLGQRVSRLSLKGANLLPGAHCLIIDRTKILLSPYLFCAKYAPFIFSR